MAKALNVSLNVSADTGQARQALQALQTQLTQLTTMPANITIGGQLKKDAVEATQAIASLQSALKNSTNMQTGNLDLTKFNYQMQQSGMQLKDYQMALNKMGPAGQQAFAKLASSISQAEVPLKRSNTLLTQFWTTMQNTLRWQLSSSVLHGFIGAIQTAYNYAKDLNQSLNNIQIVTGLSDEQMGKFAIQANKAAKALSTTTTSYTDAALIYYQQGIRDQKEIAERTDATIKMANVTGQSAQQVSDQMTAIWNNFDNGSHSLEYYADVITALGAATASSSEEISKGLEKFAAIADTVGLSYENATAALATITATTRQSADTVGTGLRTLFSRLQSLKLGETLEDSVDLTKYSKALKTIGVDVLDASGNLRDMDNILEDMGAKWQNLTDAQKTAVAQTVGGVRQYTTLMALMDNFDFYKQNQQIAMGAEGTLQKQQEIYEKSWKAAAKQLKASAESIYSDLLDDQFFIKLTKGFSKFLDLIHNTIQGMGGLKGILLAIGTLMTTVFAEKTAQRLQGIVYDLKMLSPKGREQISNLRQQGNAMLVAAAGNQGGLVGTSLSNAYKSQGELSNAYLNNVANMSDLQKDIANSLMQQQAALVRNVELSAQELQNKEQEETMQTRAVRRMMNTADGGSTAKPSEYADQVNKLTQMSKEVGKIESLFGKGLNFEIKTSGDIERLKTQLNDLGIILNNVQSYTPEVAAGFQRLNEALASGNIEEVNAALELIDNALLNAQPGIESLIEEIVSMVYPTDNESEAADRLRTALQELTKTSQAAGAGAVKLASDTNVAGDQADAAAAAMQRLGQAVQSTFSTFVTLTGVFSSIAMGINTIKNLLNTWEDPDISFGDKMLQTAIQVGIAASMMSSAFSKLQQSTTLVAAGTKLVTAAAGSANPIISSLAGAFGGVEVTAAGAAAAIAAVAAIVVAIVAVIVALAVGIARAVTTGKEHLENLTTQTEMAKTAAEEAKEAYDNLLSGASEHSELLDKLQELTEGTLEFKQALLEANSVAQNLINTYGLSSNDYSVDSRGAIRINDSAYVRIKEEQLTNAQDRQQEYLDAQAAQKNAQLWYDLSTGVGAIGETTFAGLQERIHNQNLNNTEQDILENPDYKRLAEQYGYSNGLAFVNAVSDGSFAQRAMVQSGAANTNRISLQNRMLQQNGGKPLNQIDQLMVDALSSDATFWDTIDTKVKSYERKSDGRTVNLEHVSGLGHAGLFGEKNTLGNLEKEYASVFGDQALQDLKASDTWGNLGGRRSRREYLANAIANNAKQEAIDAQLNAQKEKLNSAELQQYKKANELTGKQIIELKAGFEARKAKGELDEDTAELEENLNRAVWNRYNTAATAFGRNATTAGIASDIIDQVKLENNTQALEQLNSVYREASTNLGNEAGKILLNNLIDSAGKIDTGLLNQMSSFDFSQGKISTLAQLQSKKGVFGTDIDTQLSSAIKSEVGEKGLFEELYQSEDFADTLADLQKEFKKTGKISADSIMEAAESSETLSDWLDVSGIGAQGLADVLNSLESGNIDNISEALIRAFGAAGELNSNLAKTYSYIDNFQEARSISDIGDFYNKRIKAVQSGFESGMLLDAPLLQSLESLFGSDLRSKYQKDIYRLTDDNNRTPQDISQQINQDYAAEIAAMKSIQQRGNLSGMFEYYDKRLLEGKQDMFDYNAKTGQVVAKSREELTAMGYDSQDAFIKGLQENYGMSEDMARNMASEYAVTNGNIAQLWRETGAKKGLEEFFGGEEGSVINANDIRAFYDQYQDVLDGMEQKDIAEAMGLDPSEFEGKIEDVGDLLDILGKKADETGENFVDLGENFDFSTASLEDLQDAFNKGSNGKTFNEYLGVTTTGVSYDDKGHHNGALTNFDDVKNKLQSLGATASQAYGYIDQMREAGKFDDFSSSIERADGSMVDLSSSSKEYTDWLTKQGLTDSAAAWDQYVQHMREALSAQDALDAQSQMITEAIKTAFTELGEEDLKFSVSIDNVNQEKLDAALKEKTVDITLNITNPNAVSDAVGDGQGAAGYNNAKGLKGFAGGRHSNNQYEGPAIVGELGPEAWIHDGQAQLVGQHGREMIYLHKDDSIYTAAETREMPGFSVGYNQVQWGKAGGANAGNAKTNKYDPERYHLITRQLKDLQREYDRLDKIKENCYGTNKLEAIQREIDATKELINGQKELIKEAEDYLEIDKKRLKSLLANGEFQVDENGNLLNFEELQKKYRKKAEEDKDEHAQDIWKALQQYEETLDKLHDANTELQDLIYQQSELALEAITTKVELKIDFDERDMKLIEHFMKKIDDNIYDTARVLQLAGLSLDKINDKIDTTRQGITEIFENMTDSKGNQITDMSLEKFLSLSEAERDALDINHDFGKQLEEYSDDLLDYIEDLEDLKTKGIDELNKAFDELNDNIQSSMDLFNYYQDTLDNLKNIIDLQGVTISKDLRDVFQTINQTLLSNNANNIQTEIVRYEKLRDVVIDLQNKLLTVTDPALQKEWENQLKEAEEALRNSQTNLLTLWQNGLDMAKQIFEQNIDNAVREFEEQVAGAYGDLNGLQAAYDRRKEIDNFYVDDYEKYYQISKLQRQINKDLNDAAKNHNRNVKGLNILFNDLNNAREAGVELTAYDLDIFAKRYAYEKALMDLEDSRNAKQQVRLQRDANGNWGYVYTAAEDDDDLIRKQQAVEDALYEWQKATTAEANRYSDEILPKIRANLEAIAEAYKTGSDIPQNILNDTKELLSLWGPQFQKTLEDGAQTLDIAIDRYNNASFDIFDNLNESGLAAVLETGEGIDQLLDILISQMDTANDEMNTASINYKNQIDNLNNFFKEYGDSLGTVINAWAQAIGEDSEENKANTTQMIENAKLTFDEILLAANEFEDKFMEKYEPIISRNEQFIIALNEALDTLNRKEFVQGQLLPYIGSYIDPSSFASGGFTGAWGSGGRLAILHEKENVFNADDTYRLLNAANILRSIDLSISSFAAGFGNILLPNLAPIGNSLDQNVRIEASFPSVTDHNEIELAFDNLINKASQYANRKNMSSMTFQDMYTSKF